MPRRIRIDFNTTTVGNCDICGEQSDALLSLMTTKNYGANYAMWQHPLTPYRIPLKEGGEFLLGQTTTGRFNLARLVRPYRNG